MDQNVNESSAAAFPPAGRALAAFLKVVGAIRQLVANSVQRRLGARAICWASVWTALQMTFAVRLKVRSCAHDHTDVLSKIERYSRDLRHPVQAWAAP